MQIKVKGQGVEFTTVGENVASHMTEDGMLLLAINPKTVLRSSQSGKSDTVATTGGNIPLCGIKLGINAYKPLDKVEASQRQNAAKIAEAQARIDAA